MILLAEDDPAIRLLVFRVLQTSGYAVYDTADGLEALEVFQACSDSVTLLLTDIDMPRKNGIELAREARALRDDLPVLFMSGDFARWGDATGSFNCLAKPLQIGTLLEAVENELRGSGCSPVR